jgi:hypothetical protein
MQLHLEVWAALQRRHAWLVLCCAREVCLYLDPRPEDVDALAQCSLVRENDRHAIVNAPQQLDAIPCSAQVVKLPLTHMTAF